MKHELALRPGFSAQARIATDGATCVTRREAGVTGFDCGAGAVLGTVQRGAFRIATACPT